MKRTLLIASKNIGKIREIKAILSPLEIKILSPHDLNLDFKVIESGSTYAENARIKAQAYLSATALAVLADDSGLEVDRLGGAPGIHSARYSPQPGADDADRRAYLLSQLEGRRQPWKAHFHCSAVLALPNGKWIETMGICKGIIIPEERGSGGFGYDPIFFLPEYNATMAELLPEVKNQISHRAKAIQAMLPKIQNEWLAR